MARKKEIKIKNKVETTEKISPDVDALLMEMSKLSLDKMTTGKMKIKVETVNGVITKDEFSITGELSEKHKVLATKAKELAHATLKGVKDGKIEIQFEQEIKLV